MPRRSYKKTQSEELLDLADEYKAIHGDRIVDPKAVIRWAIAQGRYTKPPQTMQQRGTAELRRALRQARQTDPQGRTVRTHHPAVYEIEGEQLTLWARIDDAEPKHMQISSQLRRQGIFADVVRLKVDMESYNENNAFDARIPLFSFNFELDLAEAELPTEYNEDDVDVDLDELDDADDTDGTN